MAPILSEVGCLFLDPLKVTSIFSNHLWIIFCLWFSTVFSFLMFVYFKREKEQAHVCEGEDRGERESQERAVSTGPTWGLISPTMTQWPQPKSNAKCLNDWATQAPLVFNSHTMILFLFLLPQVLKDLWILEFVSFIIFRNLFWPLSHSSSFPSPGIHLLGWESVSLCPTWFYFFPPVLSFYKLGGSVQIFTKMICFFTNPVFCIYLNIAKLKLHKFR